MALKSLKKDKISLFKGCFHIPVLNISATYTESYDDKNKILVDYKDKICNVEGATELFFESSGFTVLEGREVNVFLWFFLLQTTSPHNKIYNNMMDPLKSIQKRRRLMLKKVLEGTISIEKLVKSALRVARIYYLSSKSDFRKKREQERIFQLKSQVQEEIGQKGWERKSEKSVIDSERENFLGHLEECILCCFRRQDLKNLSVAYERMIKGSPPDLFVYHLEKREWYFVEVKSLEDRLSAGQYNWIQEFQKVLKNHFILARVIPHDYYLRRYLM